MTVMYDDRVWDVYDLRRTARLNVKYYSARLETLRRRAFLIDLALAIAAPTSAVAGLWFWDTTGGQVAWRILAVIAAIFAVAKPLLKLVDAIGTLEEVVTGYRTLDHDLDSISIRIRHKGAYDAELQNEFTKALERKGALLVKEPTCRENAKLKSLDAWQMKSIYE